MKKAVVTMIAAMILLASAIAFAQAPGGPPPDRKEMEGRIEMMKMWKLTEVLNLDEATAAKFFPILKKYEANIRDVADVKMETARKLRQAIDSGKVPPKKDTLAMINSMLDQDQKIKDMRKKEAEDISQVLSDEQLAKFVLFMAEFRTRLRNMIEERGRGGRPGEFRDRGEEGGGPGLPFAPDVP